MWDGTPKVQVVRLEGSEDKGVETGQKGSPGQERRLNRQEAPLNTHANAGSSIILKKYNTELQCKKDKLPGARSREDSNRNNSQCLDQKEA